MKKAMMVILVLAALGMSGCDVVKKMDCREAEVWGHHIFRPYTKAVWNDDLKAEVQERNCDCCNVKEIRKVQTS